jgi:hypothetical protein
MWISGPITTVHDERICHELTAVARISMAILRWISDRSRSAAVVLGNHPISVGRSKGTSASRQWIHAEIFVIVATLPARRGRQIRLESICKFG